MSFDDLTPENTIVGPDGTVIGNTGDKLKTTATLENPDDPNDGLRIEPTQKHQVDFIKLQLQLDEIIRQFRILNVHMECITDLENVEEEPGDHPIV